MVPSVEGSSPFAHPRMTAGPEPYGSGPPLLHRGVAKRLRHGTLTPASLVRFQPSLPEYDPVAQLVEHLPFKPVVRGSSPRRVTTEKGGQSIVMQWIGRPFCCALCQFYAAEWGENGPNIARDVDKMWLFVCALVGHQMLGVLCHLQGAHAADHDVGRGALGVLGAIHAAQGLVMSRGAVSAERTEGWFFCLDRLIHQGGVFSPRPHRIKKNAGGPRLPYEICHIPPTNTRAAPCRSGVLLCL